MKEITQSLIKQIASLKQTKYRKKYGLFLAEGEKLLKETVAAGLQIEYVLILKDVYKKIRSTLPADIAEEKMYLISEKQMKKISTLETPPGIMVIGKQKKMQSTENILQLQEPVIVLDHVQDPGNVGTISRTALWFGVRHIILSSDCADRYNPKVIRASMGAVFHQQFYRYQNASELIPLLDASKFQVIISGLEGKSLYELKQVTHKWALILGNESRGVSEEFQKKTQMIYKVPGAYEFDSLNVSVAAGIFVHYLTFIQSRSMV